MNIVFEESHTALAIPLFFQPPTPDIVTKEKKYRETGRDGMMGRTATDPTLELVQLALAGHEEALSILVDRLTPVIQARVSRSLLRRPGEIRETDAREYLKDLTQEVFVGLLKNNGETLRRWDPARGASLENYVGFITERQVISCLRRAKGQTLLRGQTLVDAVDGPELVDPSPEASPERRTASRELLQCLVASFRDKLSPLGWTMFEMLFVWDGSVGEVSREMEMNRDAVRKWRTRLRGLARQWVEKCEKKGWAHG